MGTAIRFAILMLLLCGIVYPLTMTAVGQAFFPNQANGSLFRSNTGKVMGSTLIAQSFTRPEYFHPRPSANNYDAANSGGSNLGATSQKLITRILQDSRSYQQTENASSIPIDAVTTSASGLDPDISLANALAQIPRVAKSRGIPPKTLETLIQQYREPVVPGILSKPRINVLKLNLALDQMNRRAS